MVHLFTVDSSLSHRFLTTMPITRPPSTNSPGSPSARCKSTAVGRRCLGIPSQAAMESPVVLFSDLCFSLDLLDVFFPLFVTFRITCRPNAFLPSTLPWHLCRTLQASAQAAGAARRGLPHMGSLRQDSVRKLLAPGATTTLHDAQR